MNFPALIIEVPRQRPAEAYQIFDREDFARIYGDQVSEWLDRHPEVLEQQEDGQPVPGGECCEANDDIWCRAISDDLHTIVTVESVDEARWWTETDRAVHQSARIRALICEHAPMLWGEAEVKVVSVETTGGDSVEAREFVE